MAAAARQDVTEWLQAWSEGDRSALGKLMPAVYAELHRIAHRYMNLEGKDHVLQTTALVHEAYLRLIDSGQQHFRNRSHFFAISAEAMRRILVDFARARRCRKRGGDARRVSLHETKILTDEKNLDVVDLNDAIEALAAVDKRKSQVVEMRFFGGLTTEEIAGVLNVSRNTVLSDWNFAKAWLCRELRAKPAFDTTKH